jgi:hypothetical protein
MCNDTARHWLEGWCAIGTEGQAATMHTLVIIVLLSASNPGGGQATTTTFLDFPDIARCEAAAKALAMTSDTGAHATILTKCVDR